MSEDVRSRIEELIKGSKVMLFMKGSKQFPACGFSSAVVQILKKESVAFEKEYSNWPTYPQLYVDGKFIGGCDIVKELHESGELARELGTAAAK
jgi:monothiol glutaredoxin